MNKYYKRSIIQRFMSEEELAAFVKQYERARLPKPYSIWGTAEDREDYIKQVKELSK